MLREREQMTDGENGFVMIGNAWIGVTKAVQVNLRRTRCVSNQKKISVRAIEKLKILDLVKKDL